MGSYGSYTMETEYFSLVGQASLASPKGSRSCSSTLTVIAWPAIQYRSGRVNSKSFVGKVFLRIKEIRFI